MSGILDTLGGFVQGGLGSAALQGIGRSLVQGIATGSTRQILWPLSSQLSQFSGAANLLGLGSALNAVTEFADKFDIVNGVGGYVAILEDHHDELEVTKHPVQTGATIADHAFKLPSRLSMQIGWSTSSTLASRAPSLLGLAGNAINPLDIASLFSSGGSDYFIRGIYQRFQTLQTQRTLVTIWTGKRIYNNMILTSLGERTSSATEHCLILMLTFEEIILTKVSTTSVPTNPNAQALPQDTTPPTDQGPVAPAPAPSFNPVEAPLPPPPPAPPPVPPGETIETRRIMFP
jgi:hypothetical protein